MCVCVYGLTNYVVTSSESGTAAVCAAHAGSRMYFVQNYSDSNDEKQRRPVRRIAPRITFDRGNSTFVIMATETAEIVEIRDISSIIRIRRAFQQV